MALEEVVRESTIGVDESLVGEALVAGRAVLASGPTGRTVAVPVVGGGAQAVLLLSRSPEADPFDRAELEMISAFAAQAAIALQLATTRHDNERLRLVNDRQDIAQDLHRRVIQQLFGLGLDLQGIAARIPNETIRTLLSARIDEIDLIIRDVRTAVFSLRERPHDAPIGVTDSRRAEGRASTGPPTAD